MSLDLSNEAMQNLEVWTTQDIHLRYRAISARMIEVMNERAEIARELPTLQDELSYKIAHTRITKKNEGHTRGHKLTVSDLADIATTECRQEQLRFDLMDERRRALDMEMRGLDSVLGMLRSVGKDSREMSGGQR